MTNLDSLLKEISEMTEGQTVNIDFDEDGVELMAHTSEGSLVFLGSSLEQAVNKCYLFLAKMRTTQ